MFRVASNRTIFWFSVIASISLLALAAPAQDQSQPSQPKDDIQAQQDQKATDQKGQDQNGQDQKAADKNSKKDAAAQGQPPDAVDPLKRPVTEKERKKNAKALKQELSKPYKKWLDEDVVYIITDEERAAFKQLSNDE